MFPSYGKSRFWAFDMDKPLPNFKRHPLSFVTCFGTIITSPLFESVRSFVVSGITTIDMMYDTCQPVIPPDGRGFAKDNINNGKWWRNYFKASAMAVQS